MFTRLMSVLSMVVLTGCGIAYIPSQVSQSGAEVRVVSLTAETVLAANQTPYAPRVLPAAFRQGTGSVPAGRGAGALPDPTLERPVRPDALSLRLPPDVPDSPYRIGVGDVVLLATRDSANTVEELSGLLAAQNRRQGYTVQDDGAIAIPDVGRVVIAGLSLEEAEAELFRRLLDNQIDPTFSLELSEFNSKRVSIGGAVGTPTIVPITLTPLTLDQALSAAGGIQSPDLDFVSIRIYRDGTLYQIPLDTYLSRGDIQKSRLVTGDSVFVDTAYQLERAQAYFEEQITLAQFRQNARINALAELQAEMALRRAALTDARETFQVRAELDAVNRDYVYLAGEVNSPARFTLPPERVASLADALFSEGGYSSETANPSEIYVLRGSDDPRELGAVTAFHLDASNAANLLLATRFELRPNDVVFIAEQPVTRWNRVVQQIVPSLLNTAAAATTN
ncbi:MAG: polysaccharide biosynthesis/export family protein [Pseudomonadota bacterium]